MDHVDVAAILRDARRNPKPPTPLAELEAKHRENPSRLLKRLVEGLRVVREGSYDSAPLQA